MSYMKYLREDQWDRIAGRLPGFSGTVGRPVEDNRRFVEGVIWVGRNGGRWRSLPAEYGKWGSVHKRFKRLADKGGVVDDFQYSGGRCGHGMGDD